VKWLAGVACLAVSTAAAAEPLSFGVRIARQWVFLEGDGPPADLVGFGFQLDAAYPIRRGIAIAAGVDVGLFPERSDRLPPGSAAKSLAPFAGVELDTSPGDDISARIDIATGYRWLELPLSSGPTDRFRSWEALAVHAGPAWRSHGLQLAVMAGFGFGVVMARRHDGTCAVTGSCADSLFDSDTQSSAHFIADLAFQVRGWL
jgi:hypothetical protein